MWRSFGLVWKKLKTSRYTLPGGCKQNSRPSFWAVVWHQPQHASETSLFIAFANFTQHFAVDAFPSVKGVTWVYRWKIFSPPRTEIDSAYVCGKQTLRGICNTKRQVQWSQRCLLVTLLRLPNLQLGVGDWHWVQGLGAQPFAKQLNWCANISINLFSVGPSFGCHVWNTQKKFAQLIWATRQEDKNCKYSFLWLPSWVWNLIFFGSQKWCEKFYKSFFYSCTLAVL